MQTVSTHIPSASFGHITVWKKHYCSNLRITEPAHEIMVLIGTSEGSGEPGHSAVSPEPSLFAHIKYGCRRRLRPKIRHLAPLDGRVCASKNEFTEDEKCHNLMRWLNYNFSIFTVFGQQPYLPYKLPVCNPVHMGWYVEDDWSIQHVSVVPGKGVGHGRVSLQVILQYHT